MPTDTRALVDKLRNIVLYGRGFVGVDIGSSSTKIVQLSIQDGIATVDTYGMISNSAYADSEEGQAAYPKIEKASGEVSDLLHEIGALSRRAAVSIPFSETLMQPVELPKRDPEQMRRIVPVEAQKYIPLPVNEILLDWYAIPEEDMQSLETVKPHAKTEAHMQDVMLVGINKTTAAKFLAIASGSGLNSEFCEIEAFSALRSCTHAKKAPTLVIDFGASSTKLYIVDQHWVMHAARVAPTGGDAITAEIRGKTPMTYAQAEALKCEHGLTSGSPVFPAIETALMQLWNYIGQLLDEQQKAMGRKVENVLIFGGGSYMPGIIEYTQNKLNLPVERLPGFSRVKGPMILEDTFKEDGPLYAVAAGLALRGIGM